MAARSTVSGDDARMLAAAAHGAVLTLVSIALLQGALSALTTRMAHRAGAAELPWQGALAALSVLAALANGAIWRSVDGLRRGDVPCGLVTALRDAALAPVYLLRTRRRTAAWLGWIGLSGVLALAVLTREVALLAAAQVPWHLLQGLLLDPALLDAALLGPGRLDQRLPVPRALP